MRPTLLGLLALSWTACDPSGVKYVGPGDGLPTDDDTGATTPGGGGSACDRRQVNGTCTAYTGPGWDDISTQSDCANGNLIADGCPPSDIGGCTKVVGGALEFILWYYQGEYFTASSEAALQTECETLAGIWQ